MERCLPLSSWLAWLFTTSSLPLRALAWDRLVLKGPLLQPRPVLPVVRAQVRPVEPRGTDGLREFTKKGAARREVAKRGVTVRFFVVGVQVGFIL